MVELLHQPNIRKCDGACVDLSTWLLSGSQQHNHTLALEWPFLSDFGSIGTIDRTMHVVDLQLLLRGIIEKMLLIRFDRLQLSHRKQVCTMGEASRQARTHICML